MIPHTRIAPALAIPLAVALQTCPARAAAPAPESGAGPRPNILFVLCDDLGYGDVKCNNPEGKIPTPHVDRLAAQGVRFTDAHTTSSVCSPTRYGVVTGRYNWRSRLQRGVLGGLSPRLIEPGRATVASILRDAGYRTACIGKWHLGMDWAVKEGCQVSELDIEKADQVWNVDFSKPIANGPTSVGFEFYFGISASLDMVPYTFIENDHVTALPTEDRALPMSPDRPDSMSRKGPAAPGFTAEGVLPAFTRRAIEYIDARAAEAKAGHPFFLYLPLASPHTPIAPNPQWRGRSGLNAYADFVMETDDAFGQILAALDRNGIARDTLVIFTSDNGCSPMADIDALQRMGHRPCGPFRGHKADIWDGGHRVPFIARWPARVRPGRVDPRLLSLVDLMATCAQLAGVALPPDAGEDSVSFLPALLDADAPRARGSLVHHSIGGRFALRDGDWKLALCPGSGGWSKPRDPEATKLGLPRAQLYNMAEDAVETTNHLADLPAAVDRLTRALEKIVADGRSTPGPNRPNAVPVDLYKRDADRPGKR